MAKGWYLKVSLKSDFNEKDNLYFSHFTFYCDFTQEPTHYLAVCQFFVNSKSNFWVSFTFDLVSFENYNITELFIHCQFQTEGMNTK